MPMISIQFFTIKFKMKVGAQSHLCKSLSFQLAKPNEPVVLSPVPHLHLRHLLALISLGAGGGALASKRHLSLVISAFLYLEVSSRRMVWLTHAKRSRVLY
jgi:hypothetical protein